MPVTVGNLLNNPNANSFISLTDAESYLAPEAVTEWDGATDDQKSASLVRASRWMAVTLPWCEPELTPDQLRIVGIAAARIASDTMDAFLMTAEQPGLEVRREKVGPIEVEYRDVASSASGGINAGGRVWPWLMPMLKGIVCPPQSTIGVLVV